jgi:hypothetical protein
MAITVTITDDAGGVFDIMKISKSEDGEVRSDPVLAARVANLIERKFEVELV